MGLSGDTDKQFGWGCRLGSPAGSAGPRAVLRAEQGRGQEHLERRISSGSFLQLCPFSFLFASKVLSISVMYNLVHNFKKPTMIQTVGQAMGDLCISST